MKIEKGKPYYIRGAGIIVIPTEEVPTGENYLCKCVVIREHKDNINNIGDILHIETCKFLDMDLKIRIIAD